MEEIVGDIQDEFDNERPEVERKDGILSLDGRMLLEEVSDYLDIELTSNEVDTLAGWIYTQIDHTPKVGDLIREGNWQFMVEEVDHYRITRVQVTRLAPKPDTAEASEEP